MKESRKRLRKTFLGYFTIPKIALTVLMLFILLAPLYLLPFDKAKTVWMCSIVGIAIAYAAYYLRFIIREYKKPRKSLLELSASNPYFSLDLIFFIPLEMFNIFNLFSTKFGHSPDIFTPAKYILFSVVIVVALIISLAAFDVFKENYERTKSKFSLAFH